MDKDVKNVVKDPKEDQYDYELLYWQRNEWSKCWNWNKGSYKPWIYGD